MTQNVFDNEYRLGAACRQKCSYDITRTINCITLINRKKGLDQFTHLKYQLKINVCPTLLMLLSVRRSINIYYIVMILN